MKKLFTILILFSLYGVPSGSAVFAASPIKRNYGREVHKSRFPKTKSRTGSRRRRVVAQAVPTPMPVKMNSSLEAPEVPSSEVGEDAGMLSGNVVVPINTSSNAIIKIGLSPHGIAMIDFPSNDPVYEVHPADENFVTVGCGQREKTTDSNRLGRCLDSPYSAIILRPGTAFNEWANGVDASTIVTVQRVSGLVIPIIIIPVKKITQNANYVVVRYDVKKVVEARQAAGLSFNLNTQNQLTLPPQTADLNLKSGGNDLNIISAPPVAGDSERNVDPELLTELRRAGTTKPALRFGKPVHGISLALASHSARLTENSIEVIAVKNTLNVPIRLTPEQPNLVIETLGEKNKGSVLSKDVEVLEIASNASAEDILKPNEIYYFAFSYKTPILGAKQTLWASFAHRAASDEPATLMLGDLIK